MIPSSAKHLGCLNCVPGQLWPDPILILASTWLPASLKQKQKFSSLGATEWLFQWPRSGRNHIWVISLWPVILRAKEPMRSWQLPGVPLELCHSQRDITPTYTLHANEERASKRGGVRGSRDREEAAGWMPNTKLAAKTLACFSIAHVRAMGIMYYDPVPFSQETSLPYKNVNKTLMPDRYVRG